MLLTSVLAFPKDNFAFRNLFLSRGQACALCPHFEQLEQNGVRDLKTAHLKGAIFPTSLIICGITFPSYFMTTLWVNL